MEEVTKTRFEIAMEEHRQRKERESLLAIKAPEVLPEVFIEVSGRSSLKAEMPTLEFPFFSLTKIPDRNIRKYKIKDGYLEIRPGPSGNATIWDRDILLFLCGQIVQKMDRKEPASKTIRFALTDYMRATKKTASGMQYKLIIESLERLNETTIRTNVKTNGVIQREGFHLIESWKVVDPDELDAKKITVQVVLSDWTYNAIAAREVLTISDDYLRITSSLKKRLYEIARKNCGQQPVWKMHLSLLHGRTGSQTELRFFRRDIKKIAEENDIPQYSIVFDVEKDTVTFSRRESEPKSQKATPLLFK